MKKLATGLSCILIVVGLAFPAIAKGPVEEIVTINWVEDAIRYNPDDSVKSRWTDDPLGPADLVKTGKAYHFASIQEYYNWPLDNLSGKLVISGSGGLSGHARYTSPTSQLPIKDRFKGEVTIIVSDDGGTMEGTYTQWSYAFGTWEEVEGFYGKAVPEGKRNSKGSGWWFIGYTDYTAKAA